MNMRLFSRLRMKRNHKTYRTMMLVVFLAFVFAAAGQCIQSSSAETQRQHKFDLYGQWKGAVYGALNQTEASITSHASVERIGLMKGIGTVKSDNGYGSCFLGTANSEAVELGHITLIEGRLPEKDGEIAIERGALLQLGYSYDLGQTIMLDINYTTPRGDGVTEKRAYQLTGTMKTFSVNWNRAEGGPVNAFISDKDVLNSKAKAIPIVLFEGTDINQTTIYEFRSILSETEKLVFNENAYKIPEKSLKEMLSEHLISIIILLGSISFLFYTASLSLRSQKHEFQLMLVLGARRKQLWQLVLYDYTRIFAVTAFPGIAVGILLAYLMTMLQNRWMNDATLFYIQPFDLLFAVFIVFVASVLSMFWPFAALPLAEGAKKQEKVFSGKLKPIRSNLFERDYLKRMGLIHRKSVLLRVCILAVLSFCIFVTSLNIIDLGREFKTAFYTLNGRYHWYYYDFHGFSEQNLKDLKKIEGISEVDAMLSAANIDITWDGCEESQYRTHIYKDVYATAKDHGNTLSVDKNSNQFQYYSNEVDRGSITKEDLADGKCIIYLPALIVGRDGGYTNYNNTESARKGIPVLQETTLSIGDILQIESELGHLKLEVGAVLYETQNNPHTHSVDRMGALQPLSVIVDKAYVEHVFQKEYLYNQVVAFGDLKALSTTTDKEISRIRVDGRAEFYNLRETYEISRGELLAEVSSRLLFAALVFVLGSMVLFQNVLKSAASESGKQQLLDALGMSKKQKKRLFIKKTAKEIACGIFAGFLPVFILYYCLPFYQIWSEEKWNFSFNTSLQMWLMRVGEGYLIASLAVAAILFFSFFLLHYAGSRKKYEDVT